MYKPRISIIIATYNSGKTIKIALDSVCNLDFQDWECILVDGMSKDDTLSIIKEYSNKDSRLRYISEKDNGIYDALNKGVKMSKGEWIYVLGSDDEVTPDGLSRLLAMANENDVVYGDAYIKHVDGSITTFPAKNVGALKYVMICSHQAVIMRKTVIENLGGFNLEYKIRADFDLMQRAYLEGYSFAKVQVFVTYFLTAGMSSKADVWTHIERYHICKNNHSTKIPLFWYLFQEAKFFVNNFLKMFQRR